MNFLVMFKSSCVQLISSFLGNEWYKFDNSFRIALSKIPSHCLYARLTSHSSFTTSMTLCLFSSPRLLRVFSNSIILCTYSFLSLYIKFISFIFTWLDGLFFMNNLIVQQLLTYFQILLLVQVHVREFNVYFQV